MSELIVAGFDDEHTALMARAALARVQKDLSLDGHDVAVVSLADDGGVTVREAIHLNGNRGIHETLWKIIAGLLFRTEPGDRASDGKDERAACSVIGVDETFHAGVAKAVQPGASAILVLVDQPMTRDKVLGILAGFQGRVMKTRLVGENRVQWLATLSGDENS